MKLKNTRPFQWAILYTLVLACFTTFVLLDTFVIARAGTPVSAMATMAAAAAGNGIGSATQATTGTASGTGLKGNAAAGATTTDTASAASAVTGQATANGQAAVTATSYKDANIQISIETVRQYDTNIYIADVQITSAEYLKTAFASGTYGRNFKATTSGMAKGNGAILAINGDYYGFRNDGFVLRNGVLYRATAPTSVSTDALVIDKQGNFSIIDQKSTAADSIRAAWQVLSFGPALVNGGQITVNGSSEVGQSMASNPRTAIGQVSANHYIFVVSDGRTSESTGLSLLELAHIFKGRGCTVAYNLDGGGSSTMWFNGRVVNKPTDGRSAGERSVSDIVYIG